MEAGTFHHVFADEVGEDLVAPAVGVFRPLGEARFGEDTAGHEVVEGLGRISPLLLAPFPHRNGVQAGGEVAAGQGIAALVPGIHEGAAGDQQHLPGGAAVHDALEPVLPLALLVDFVHGKQRRPGRPIPAAGDWRGRRPRPS